MAPLTQRERFHLCDGFSMRSHAAPVSGRRNNQIVKGSGPMITSTAYRPTASRCPSLSS